ncbi:MAG TPA: hypothetical protein VJ996_06415 [Solirubrobacteraceae bacterium]|nr:hypothetical protein [Solirubrobacteraceae bacterium]
MPPSERGHWLLAGTVAALGAAVLVAVLTGLVGRSTLVSSAAPPPVLVVAATPVPGTSGGSAGASAGPSSGTDNGIGGGAIVAQLSAAQQSQALARLTDPLQTQVSTRWMEGFYPIYSVAQSTFGVNWLLIASIHEQESAFSTAPSTYHGLNFAHCCGGPMQFNVINGGRGTGSGSTWDLVSDSYIYGRRPAVYDHMTATHPSIYDDFDAIMAAAHLLSADGARLELNARAWNAAYDYYGHDIAGVTYADQVLARAIGWSQHGFCVNCGLDAAMVEAVHAAYGAPVLAALEAEAEAKPKPKQKPKPKPKQKATAARTVKPGRRR